MRQFVDPSCISVGFIFASENSRFTCQVNPKCAQLPIHCLCKCTPGPSPEEALTHQNADSVLLRFRPCDHTRAQGRKHPRPQRPATYSPRIENVAACSSMDKSFSISHSGLDS